MFPEHSGLKFISSIAGFQLNLLSFILPQAMLTNLKFTDTNTEYILGSVVKNHCL